MNYVHANKMWMCSGMWQLHQSLGEMHDSWRYHWVSQCTLTQKKTSHATWKNSSKEFLVRSMTHGNPTEFTHALSLEKENENERLPWGTPYTLKWIWVTSQNAPTFLEKHLKNKVRGIFVLVLSNMVIRKSTSAFTTLRFLSTTRINHAGLLFGKHHCWVIPEKPWWCICCILQPSAC